jgi:Tfp pilus assembly protein PilN
MKPRLIEINLLPQEMRPRHGAGVSSMPIVQISTGIIFVLILIYIALVGASAFRAHQHSRLQQIWAQLEPQHQDYLTLIRQVQTLRDRKTLENRILESQTSWAQKLSLLTDALPLEVWLTELSVIQTMAPAVLTLRGSVQTQSRAGSMQSITHFIETLKQSENGFMEGFSSLELGPIENRPDVPNSTLDFTIYVYLKKGGSRGR